MSQAWVPTCEHLCVQLFPALTFFGIFRGKLLIWKQMLCLGPGSNSSSPLSPLFSPMFLGEDQGGGKKPKREAHQPACHPQLLCLQPNLGSRVLCSPRLRLLDENSVS